MNEADFTGKHTPFYLCVSKERVCDIKNIIFSLKLEKNENLNMVDLVAP